MSDPRISQPNNQQAQHHATQPEPQDAKPRSQKPLIITLIAAITAVLLVSAGIFAFLANGSNNHSSTDSANPPIVLPSCDKANSTAQARLAKDSKAETVQFTETDLFKSLSEPVQKLLQKSKTSVACDWKLSGDAKVVQNISAINANDKEQLVQELRKNPEIKEIKQAETTVFVQKVKAEGTSNSAAPQQITYVPSDKSMAVLKTPEKGAEQFTKSANDALKIAEGKEVAKPKAEEFKPLVIPTCDNANAAFTERLAKVGPPPVWKVEEQKLNMHPDDAKAMPEMAKAITNGRGCRWPITPRFGYFQTIAEVSLQDKEAIVSNLQAGITKTYSGGSTQSEKITFKETERRGAKVFNSANEDYVLIGNAFIKINYAMGGNTDSVSSDAAVDSALNALFAANPHLKK